MSANNNKPTGQPQKLKYIGSSAGQWVGGRYFEKPGKWSQDQIQSNIAKYPKLKEVFIEE